MRKVSQHDHQPQTEQHTFHSEEGAGMRLHVCVYLYVGYVQFVFT